MHDKCFTVEINGKTYKSVTDYTNSCSKCVTRNSTKLCMALSNHLNCDANNVVWSLAETTNQEQEDMVNYPKHYMLNVEGKTVEVRDICKALANRLGTKGYSGMFIADYVQLLQYLMRFDCKNGKEDLEKAQWYLDKLIKDYDVSPK